MIVRVNERNYQMQTEGFGKDALKCFEFKYGEVTEEDLGQLYEGIEEQVPVGMGTVRWVERFPGSIFVRQVRFNYGTRSK